MITDVWSGSANLTIDHWYAVNASLNHWYAVNASNNAFDMQPMPLKEALTAYQWSTFIENNVGGNCGFKFCPRCEIMVINAKTTIDFLI